MNFACKDGKMGQFVNVFFILCVDQAQSDLLSVLAQGVESTSNTRTYPQEKIGHIEC